MEGRAEVEPASDETRPLAVDLAFGDEYSSWSDNLSLVRCGSLPLPIGLRRHAQAAAGFEPALSRPPINLSLNLSLGSDVYYMPATATAQVSGVSGEQIAQHFLAHLLILNLRAVGLLARELHRLL